MSTRSSVFRGYSRTIRPQERICTSPAQPRTSTVCPAWANGTGYEWFSKFTMQSLCTGRVTTTSKGSGRIGNGAR